MQLNTAQGVYAVVLTAMQVLLGVHCISALRLHWK